jgi:hypothetical protein
MSDGPVVFDNEPLLAALSSILKKGTNKSPLSVMPTMSSEEPTEIDEDEHPERVEKSEDFVERFVEQSVVIEAEDHVIVDFQRTDAHILLDDSGEPSQFAGVPESTVRVYLPHNAATSLSDNLIDYQVFGMCIDS